MIVPEYWAEGRRQLRTRERQVTVRRFGWSDVSAEAAQAHADQRAEAALREILSGVPRPRREPKVPYNGAEGVPIREEVVGRHGSAVLTRNSYGAVCLNTPDVLFADVDFRERPGVELTLGSIVWTFGAAVVASYAMRSVPTTLILIVPSVPLGMALAGLIEKVRRSLRGGTEASARRRVDVFLERHPDWGLRLYRTPNGLRLIATHRTFDPLDPEVAAFFRAVGADPTYARMCVRQSCFRARLTAKPWRIRIGDHVRPRPGVWPIRPERMEERRAWLGRYDEAARGYAACAFLDAIGNGATSAAIRTVVDLHDRLSGATSGRPIA
jgi:hypothetical protein